MTDRRHKDVDWLVAGADGKVPTWERVGIAVLMDIRDELRSLNAKLLGVGPTVHEIERNTRAGRQCSKCGAGPYATGRGLRQHYRRKHG